MKPVMYMFFSFLPTTVVIGHCIYFQVEEQYLNDKVEALVKKAKEETDKEVEVETIDKPFDEQIYSWELDSLPGKVWCRPKQSSWDLFT
jgi:hypothetical protein